MNNSIDISVIVPIYNVEKYIERCLRSLFTQTKTDRVEFILVNDATPDNSMEIADSIIQEFAPINVTIINKEKNEGLVAARRSGIDRAIGDYIMHIDSDDWCDPTMLEEMYKKAIEEGADIVNADYYEAHLDFKKYVRNELSNDRFENIRLILEGERQSYLWCKLIKRSLYIENAIRVEKKFNYLEDLALCTQLFYYADKCVNISKAFYYYNRQNIASITKVHTERRYKDSIMAISEIDVFLKEKKIDALFEKIILSTKIRIKYRLFRNLKGKEQVEYMRVFPEVDNLILKTKYLKKKQKITLSLATHGFVNIANFITNLYITVNK